MFYEENYPLIRLLLHSDISITCKIQTNCVIIYVAYYSMSDPWQIDQCKQNKSNSIPKIEIKFNHASKYMN